MSNKLVTYNAVHVPVYHGRVGRDGQVASEHQA